MYKLEVTLPDGSFTFDFSTLDAALVSIGWAMKENGAVVKLWKEGEHG